MQTHVCTSLKAGSISFDIQQFMRASVAGAWYLYVGHLEAPGVGLKVAGGAGWHGIQGQATGHGLPAAQGW